MQPKTIVITGSSDGIGAAAARILKSHGHNVVIVGRNPEKTAKIAAELSAPFHTADFSRLADVKRLAAELNEKYERIDVLCNNAGGMQKERSLTEDGIERTFQINVAAGFLLTTLLLEKLQKSGATVVQTSSIASNLFGQKLDVNDLMNEKNYTPVKAYGDSKLCDVLFTRELQKRCSGKIAAVAFEPGVVRSNFAADSVWYFKIAYHTPIKYLFTISTKKSAKRMVRLAEGVPGKDFTCGETYSNGKRYRVKFRDGDGSAAKTLWETLEKLTEKYE